MRLLVQCKALQIDMSNGNGQNADSVVIMDNARDMSEDTRYESSSKWRGIREGMGEGGGAANGCERSKIFTALSDPWGSFSVQTIKYCNPLLPTLNENK